MVNLQKPVKIIIRDKPNLMRGKSVERGPSGTQLCIESQKVVVSCQGGVTTSVR